MIAHRTFLGFALTSLLALAVSCSTPPRPAPDSPTAPIAPATPVAPLHAAVTDHLAWAPTPPMGWNSWDCFGATVTEEQTKANVDYMADKLAKHGWQYVVVDIQWYEPQSTGWDYSKNPKPVLDEFGRLWPVEAKFPSAASGHGFKPLADYIHSKGLKFGVHLMRGIPREAVRRNTVIFGTTLHAADIADTNSTCPWNPDMYGVDMSKPGAQDYYNSVLALLAFWDIDYLKVDDLSRPYREAEVAAIRKAIDQTGRPILFSTSPGATPLTAGPHVEKNANLWRLTDDFWDEWRLLKPEFGIVNKWTPHRGPGHWPDPDMLPLGAIRVGPKMQRNWTRFTRAEQRTLMTLWCISQAPLMFGGHLPWNDEFTESLITNDEVLAVDQHSTGNRQLFNQGDLVAWTASVPNSPDVYLALFNAQDSEGQLDSSKAAYTSGVIRGKAGAQAADITAPITGAKRLFLVVTTGGDDFNNDHANWIEPRIIGPAGELKLTELKWKSATAGYNQARVNRSVRNQPLTRNDEPVLWGIGTHSPSVIEYDLPAGYETFKATGVLDPGSRDRGSVNFQVFTEKGYPAEGDMTAIKVNLADLGFAVSVRVRDLWAGKDLERADKEFTGQVPLHGAMLYRLSPRQ